MKKITTNRRTLIAFIICSIFIAGAFGYKYYNAFNKLYFVVDMVASTKGISQVFYDVGRGVHEEDSYKIQFQNRNLQKYIFLLPDNYIKSLRFDPINGSGVVQIKDARIENKQGDIIKKFPFQDFRPIQQISKMDTSDGTLVIHMVENSNDPIILIENSLIENHFSWNEYILKRGWIILGYGLLAFLFLIGLNYFIIFVRHNQYVISGVRSLRIYVRANPKKSIAFVGFFAAIVSCYPVVFFGMSFVSPTIFGVPQLYGYPPFLPGFSLQSIVENVRGSDVGPSPWSIVPNTVVQYEALTRYFEFPFWSRYVGGGTPLFAQGQSMIGDILHWIPVSLGGSAIGWDMKFVLSKALFAVGIGLLVFLFTRNFTAGSLIAFSSCFLGFFAYRFNHPAFFVLTYAPWIVIIWKQFGAILEQPHPHIRKCIIQGLLLAAVAWLQLNAGAPKEGVITACFMHALGILAFVDHIRHRWGWIRSSIIAIGSGLAIIMISAPYWLLFLDAIEKSFTNYDIPGAITFPLWKILGFFDNFFFQQIDGTLGAPSANMFVLLCVSSAIACLRWHKSLIFYGSMILFFLAMSFAYGVIPTSILISIPFINKIQHIFSAFSVPMMIFALILAGYGIHHYLAASEKHKKIILMLALSVFTGLCIMYLLAIISLQLPVAYSGKTIWLILPFFAVVFAVVWMLYRQAESGVWDNRTLIILACCFLLLHVRHGMHLMTGNTLVDLFIMNPTERPDFSNKSRSVEYVKSQINTNKTPSRVIGEGFVMFPGYNSMLGFESLVSVEPLRNEHFEKLLGMLDYPDIGWGWMRAIKSDQIASCAAALDLLNVGYIFATPGTQVPEGVKLIHSSDLDVWERETVWPRAFFVNQVIEVHKPTDILEALAKMPNVPFAAVESAQIPKGMLKNTDTVFHVIPARQFTLTNNSTKFSVDATSPGIIVLGETYYPEDFVATLNGERVDYIRVNEAFKGIWVEKAGRYNVTFTYRPAKLNLALILSACGMFLLLILSVVSCRLKAI